VNELEKLHAALSALDAKLDALLATDELNDEQRAEHAGLVTERNKVLASVKREEDRQAREDERAKLAESARKQAAAKKAADRVIEPAGRIVTPEAAQPLVTEQRLTIPATVRRTGGLRNFTSRNGRKADERAYLFGMWALSALSQQMPNRFRFGSATEFVQNNARLYGDRYAAAVTSKDATGTQYLIPEEFSSDIIDLRERYGVARRLFRMVPMTSDTKVIPRRQGGLTAHFVTEGAAGTESNKTWDQVRLTAKDLMVLSRHTNQVSMDVVVNFGDDLAGEISYAFANKEDDCAFNGTGSNTYGGIVGVRTKLQDCDGAGTDSIGLANATGNLYSEIVLADFNKVVGLLPQHADTDRACWVVHKAFYHTVMQKLEMAAGGVTMAEVANGDRRPRPMFAGYPVEFSQVMPSTEANTQVCALLGDFTQGAAFGDRQEESIAFSEHATVNSENVFERNEIAIRGTERFDVVVHDVGSSSAAGPIVGLQTLGS
jgi:HK97 family phage major capsid protein